ncbi:MAG: FAD-dependent oxidoreductase [Gemmatimonadetes bacterium]|uniref:FAD-dependent oxidoreductase n=1 Tax=Candidatus Kutchimonas denitrificans TaxID=3056748 RepID=A0AAE4Z6R9_9BACT|nr:FAD-dependent oxidoreductase [Gemmatimonadota bacterium]NIR73492.1 FAD-dependent oxidoreductase [Candidatus Kutchimonas denitrificans]NIS00896.1 FAD-dependent oxidoreductase [Gemmatimonadota bacterium]NIT65065.1 FAD-dependent oxidoreductase [Gemmatimonadota bacterium]NIV23055.1 FAD-dependent oxidoreductase [Gemmatimonadota bacterium]
MLSTVTSGEVVLVGAGHAHLHVASRAASFRERGIGLTLIDPDAFWYSGLATGMLGGEYEPELDRVDPRPLVESGGGRFIRDRVVGLDGDDGQALLASGARLPYDVISFNVGSEVATPAGMTVAETAWRAKPIRGLLDLRRSVEEALSPGSGRGSGALRALVIGSGDTGCEIAANLDALARSHDAAIHVTLITDAPRVLAERSGLISKRVARLVRGRGIDVHTDATVVEVGGDGCRTDDGRFMPGDLMILATGLRPPGWLADLGLELGAEGGLLVEATLRSVSDPNVFGAGDCVSLVGHELPKLGVYAVREAPVLYRNLLAAASGEPLSDYRPQKRCLTILNLGRGTGLAVWGPLHWLGPAAMWLKDRLDRRFLALYREGSDGTEPD